MKKLLVLLFCLFPLLVILLTACSSLGYLYGDVYGDGSGLFHKYSRENVEEEIQAYSRIPVISFKVKTEQVRNWFLGTSKTVEITPSDNDLESAKNSFESTKEAYENYLAVYGPESTKAYYADHYNRVEELLKQLEREYSRYCDEAIRLKERDKQQEELKAKIEDCFENLNAVDISGGTEAFYGLYENLSKLFGSYVRNDLYDLAEKAKSLKHDVDKMNVINEFNQLNEAFQQDDFEAIERLYNTTTVMLSSYQWNDLKDLVSKVEDIKNESAIKKWKASEKCKLILSTIGDFWLDLPLYVSSESLNITLREVIEETDFSSSFFDVSQNRLFSSLTLRITKIQGLNTTCTFELEENKGKLTIKEVTYPLLKVYNSYNPNNIIRIFNLIFEV